MYRRRMWLETPYLATQEEQGDGNNNVHINTQLRTEGGAKRAQRQVAEKNC